MAVQSVEPCYLYGDSDLYGLGVRLSFYLQYLAAVICIGFQRSNELKSLRLGFSTLSFAMIIGLYRNVKRVSFALMEWYIVSALIFLIQTIVFPVPLKFHYVILGTEIPAGNENHARNEEEPQRDLEVQTDGGNAGSEPRVELALDLNPRPLLEDPMGVALFLIVYCMYSLSQPWLYFTIVNSGHKDTCLARVILFYIPVNLYNKKSLAFFRASSILITVFGLFFCLFEAGYLVVWARKYHKEIEETLELVKEQEKDEIMQRPENPEPRTNDGGNSKNHPDETQPLGDASGGGATNQGHPHPTDEVGNAERRLAEPDEIEERHELLQLLNQRQREKNGWLHVGYAVVDVLLTGLFIYFIERTIILNKIQLDSPFSSTGQLLPLGVAICTISVTSYQAFTQKSLDHRELNQVLLKSSFVGNLKLAESQTRAERELLSARTQAYLKQSSASAQAYLKQFPIANVWARR